MQFAAIPNAIRTILIIVLVYYIVKYAMRMFMAMNAKKAGPGAASNRYSNPKKEGDITIEYLNDNKADSKRSRPDDADSVDFEEIEDRS